MKLVLAAIASGLFAALTSVASKLASNNPTISTLSFLIGSNVLMWFFFTKALADLKSVQVMSINTLANILFTGLFGAILFNEPVGLKWLAGVSLVFLGVLLIRPT
jgi:uncharacterized membrane protein